MYEIKSNQQNDIQTYFAKENVHIKTVESIHSQMSTLKHAIGTLADVVSEEIEHLRKVVISGDIEQKIMQTNLKLEQLTIQVNRHENERSSVNYQVEAVRDEVMTLKAIEGKKIDLVST